MCDKLHQRRGKIWGVNLVEQWQSMAEHKMVTYRRETLDL
jgi:hypothetical protein